MTVYTILMDFAFASLLILVGQFLCAKVPLVQRFFIPSSLLAGFLGFLLGKQVLNIIPFSDSLSSYTSVLMIPVFAAIGINGFTLGVQAANPNATVYVKELGAWADEVNESAFAKELIDSYKCGVISQHCDSAQPQIAAENAGVFGCGYNSDMTADAPNAHLTAAVWHWNVYYHTAIQAAMDCNGDASQFVSKMGGPAYYGGLKENFVDVSPLNEKTVAPGTQDAIDQVRELIVSGDWDVFTGTKLNITVADGKATATIEWSSSNYDYMKVDDVQYDPVNTEGNSTFEITITGFDAPIAVVADTTAMSTPHEIDYTLTFDSASLEPAS